MSFYKELTTRIRGYHVPLLAGAIFLLRLPPLYLLPIQHPLVMSHNIVRLTFILLLTNEILYHFFHSNKLRTSTVTFSVILVWFLSQSLSVIEATYISQFISAYKDIVFSIIVFFVSYYTVNQKNIRFFVLTLFISSFIHVAMQLSAYFAPNQFYILFNQLFYDKYWQFFSYQYSRQRFFGDALDETVIAIALLLIITSRRMLMQIAVYLFLGIVTFITFASNWRSKTLIYIFAFTSSMILYLKYFKKLAVIFLITIAFVIISNFLSREIIGYNVIDRLIYPENEEIATIDARLNYWDEAVDIGMSSPFFGVGLGHFYDYLSIQTQQLVMSSYLNRYRAFITIDDPHNIFFSTFATTGFTGLISLGLLFSVFFYSDFRTIIKKKDNVIKALILVYWSTVLFSLFNPWLYFSYLGYLWFVRGSIESLKNEHDQSKKS